jgi:hypothetical protein
MPRLITSKISKLCFRFRINKSRRATRFLRVSRLTYAITAGHRGSPKSTKPKSFSGHRPPRANHSLPIHPPASQSSPQSFPPTQSSCTSPTQPKHSNQSCIHTRTLSRSQFRQSTKSSTHLCTTLAFATSRIVFSTSMESFIRFLWCIALSQGTRSWRTGGNCSNLLWKGLILKMKRSLIFLENN